MEGGWALVLLYDYHHGHDFANDEDTRIDTQMGSLDTSNVHEYLDRFDKQERDKIDFRQFSKIHNPTVKTYDFNLEAILSYGF